MQLTATEQELCDRFLGAMLHATYPLQQEDHEQSLHALIAAAEKLKGRFEQELEEFRRRGAQLLGISVDSIYSHGAWAAVRGISFPLLADFAPKGEIARRYGVWREPDGFSERALYVVDPGGRIADARVSPRLHRIPDIYELLDAVEVAGRREAVSA